MRVGDKVTWKSQSHGHSKTKTGIIIVVIPRRTNPLSIDEVKKMKLCFEYGSGRDHDSYMVKANNRVYWPRVKHLKRVKGIPITGKLNSKTQRVIVNAIRLNGETEEYN
jgi:hypothetical protein